MAHKKSSDLPWIIGSLVVTVPAAGWLWQQGPSKSDHGHGHAEAKHEEAPDETPKEEEQPEEDGDKPQEEGGKDEGAEEESKDESEEEDKDEGSDKDKEVPLKGTALPDDKARKSEAKGAKDAQGDVSGANHPSIGDAKKSKKPEGVAETAKIHGTVDKSDRPAKGHHEPGKKDD